MISNIERFDSRIKFILKENFKFETVATGFEFTEGPIWRSYEKQLTFSDIVGSTMYRWNRKNGIRVFRKPSKMAQGNTCDKQGRIVTCEHSTSRVKCTELNGSVIVLASHYDGKELNSPNDIGVKRDGTIYFSDPAFGCRVGIPKPRFDSTLR